VKVNMHLTELKNQMAAQQIGGPPARSNLPEEVSEVFQVSSNEEIHVNQMPGLNIYKLPGSTELLKA